MGNGSYWDGAEWSTVQADSPFDKAKVFVQATAPVDPTPMRTGDLFIDTDTRKVQFRNGAAWTDISAGLETINISDVVGLQSQLDKAFGVQITGNLNTQTAPGSYVFLMADVTLANNHPISSGQAGTLLVSKAGTYISQRVTYMNGVVASTVQEYVRFSANSGVAWGAWIPLAAGGTTATTFALGNHTHVKANITDFAHTHVITDIPAITATAAELNILEGVTVTSTKINYLTDVTSNIQAQINAKAPTASPTFTGTVSGITAAMVGASATGHAHAGTDITSGTLAAARLPAATTAAQGAAILATAADVITGTDTTKATTPAAVNGSIVTTGLSTNANGCSIRFPDGTQICTWDSSITPTANTNTGKTWTFAQAFLTGSQPVISVTGNTTSGTLGGMYFSSATNTSVSCRIVRSTSTSTQFHAMAIGRWK